MSLYIGIPIFNLNLHYKTYSSKIDHELLHNIDILQKYNADPNQLLYQIKYIYKTTNTIPNIYLSNKQYDYKDTDKNTETYWQAKYHDLYQQVYDKHQDILKILK